MQIIKVILFNANWYILTFLNLDLVAFFTLICFWDVKINFITRHPKLIFSYAFFFVKIIHLCNAKPCLQIFCICLCPSIMRFDDRKGIYIIDDSVLLLITHFVGLSCLSRPSSFNKTVSLFFFSWTLQTVFCEIARVDK